MLNNNYVEAQGQHKAKRDWLALILSSIAIAIAVASVYLSRQNFQKSARIDAEQYLFEAWSLLGGELGKERIVHLSTDKAKLGKAQFLIENQALVLDPKNPKAYRYLGIYYLAQEKFKESIKN